MQERSGSEKRKYTRLDANFIVSYRIKQVPDDYDLSQTKNVGQGGILLTTNRQFPKGTQLLMSIRFPLVPKKIEVTGEVVESKEKAKNLIYQTRIKFLDLDESFFKDLGKFIQERSLPKETNPSP